MLAACVPLYTAAIQLLPPALPLPTSLETGRGGNDTQGGRLAYTALIHGIVSPQHGGALPRRSAMDLVAAFTHEVEAAFAQNKEVSMVTMDVQGAFDAVLRRRLLQRMAQQGWPRELLQLIDSFLTERRAQVRLEGTTTAAHQMQCGTPQGSPLSPILFLLYLAELLWQNSELRFGYADDLNIWRATHSLDNNATLLRQDIQSILRWGKINKVAFAPEKLEMIHLTRKRHNEAPAVVVSEDLTVHPVTAPAGQEPALRWLGVHFDRRLTWRPHVSTRAKKARAVAQHIRSLGKTRDGPPADALRKAVTTCVVPSLLYGTEAWYGGRTQPARHTGRSGERGPPSFPYNAHRCPIPGCWAPISNGSSGGGQNAIRDKASGGG
ncbi:conserved hypothetical protein [Histoplasma mississippiense (nom. inval.)]|uniref:conserved hypothetical protein n=1 Tax=Ajellomyces capsulatus (strain NAm1 / WU24) TaxID=2059318 RepID=UPI000157D5D6|nr:conserved hypothetical protein [Histoplasma mississippiense (nom. inval.)]EDN05156.1 conserved hypothetical protein [Histoplasma mississippiense (nom. inval.)]